MAPSTQIAVGYNFNQVVGLRLAANSWRSKAALSLDEHYYWKWNYIADARRDIRHHQPHRRL